MSQNFITENQHNLGREHEDHTETLLRPSSLTTGETMGSEVRWAGSGRRSCALKAEEKWVLSQLSP